MSFWRTKPDLGNELINWIIPEIEKKKRSIWWFVGVSIITSLILIYAIKTENYMFGVIIAIAVAVLFIQDAQTPLKVRLSLSDTGVVLGRSEFYKYSEIKDFSFIEENNKEIIFFKSKDLTKPSFIVPADIELREKIRNILLKNIKENTDRRKKPLEDRLVESFLIRR